MGGGAIPPVVALAHGLVDRGHRVVMICEQQSSQQFVDTEIGSIVIPESSELSMFWETTHILEWNKTLAAGGSLDDVENAYTAFGNAARGDVIDAVRDLRPDGIFTSLFTLGLAEILGQELQIPWTFVNPVYAFAAGSARSAREDFPGGLGVYIREKWMPEILESAALVLHSTDREYDPTTDGLPANNHHVGPLNSVAPGDPPNYLLEEGPSWALVSVSLVPAPGELEIVRLALGALTELDLRVLVTAPRRADEIDVVPSNAIVVDRAPHDLVLQRSSIAISNAGHGLVMNPLI